MNHPLINAEHILWMDRTAPLLADIASKARPSWTYDELHAWVDRNVHAFADVDGLTHRIATILDLPR